MLCQQSGSKFKNDVPAYSSYMSGPQLWELPCKLQVQYTATQIDCTGRGEAWSSVVFFLSSQLCIARIKNT